MKVLLLNGSRRTDGCTYTALSIVARALNEEGIETEIFSFGKEPLAGNINDFVNVVADKVKGADGLVVGTPVYYASPSAEVQTVLDRLFSRAGKDLRLKPACAVASARRAGTTAAIDVINKYFTYAEMPVVSSRYWNEVHGYTPEDVLSDKEGVQIMEVLGRNMAWLLKCIEQGKKAGIPLPPEADRVYTNFI